MKRLILITGVLLLGYVVLTATEPNAQPVLSDKAPTSASTVSGLYTLTDYDGRVAVMLDGALYLQTDVPVSLLPKADRVRLHNGVTFYSLDEMKSALEDYCG